MARIDIRSNGGGGSVAEGVLQLENGVAMDTTLRNVADQNNTTSPLKLSTTAVQVNSPLRITTSDASGFYLDAEDSATNNRFSIKRDPSSQEVTLDFASNPAGSTTLVGAIRTYQDGVNLSNAMSFIEDGSVGIGTNAPVGILHLKTSAKNTRFAIDGDAGFNKLISYRTAGLQRFGLYVNNTAESGSNAGSDFAIRAYSDAGTLLNTSVFIKRSTGFLGVGNVTAPTQQLHVNGSLRIQTGGIYDGTNSIGTSGQVLSSTGTSTAWITPSTPAGSTGAVQFNNAGAFGADSTNLFWNDTNKRLGIGTNAPSSTLEVNGGTLFSAILATYSGFNGGITSHNSGTLDVNKTAQFRLVNGSTQFSANDRSYQIVNIGKSSTASDLYFQYWDGSSYNERFRIASDGNVGVNNNAPTARLQIKGSGSTSATTSLLVQNSAGSNALQVRDDRVIIMAGLPTSPSGLPSGALWNNLGILSVA